MKTKTQNKPSNNCSELQRVNDQSASRIQASLDSPVQQLRTEADFPEEKLRRGGADVGRSRTRAIRPPAAGAGEGARYGSARLGPAHCTAPGFLCSATPHYLTSSKASFSINAPPEQDTGYSPHANTHGQECRHAYKTHLAPTGRYRTDTAACPLRVHPQSGRRGGASQCPP